MTYIACAVVANDEVDEGDEEILDVLAPPIRQVGAEWVKNDQVLVR